MANRDFPSGLRPIRNQKNPSGPEVMAMDCVTTVLYEGALLMLSNTGLVRMALTGVVTSANAKQIIGVCAVGKAAGAVGADGSTSKVLVYTDPDQLFAVQSDDATMGSITSYMGLNFAVLGAISGNSTTVRSIMELDGSTGDAATTSSTARILKVVARERVIGGDLTSWGKFIVQINPKFHLRRNNGGV